MKLADTVSALARNHELTQERGWRLEREIVELRAEVRTLQKAREDGLRLLRNVIDRVLSGKKFMIVDIPEKREVYKP